jgi:hypothetical protein
MDRFIEIDIDVFGVDSRQDQVAAVMSRLCHAWRNLGSESTCGLVLNLGWLMDPIVLWSGDGDQRLPISSTRLESWSQLTYADLRQLVLRIRQAALEEGIESLRVGMLVLGIGEFVNEIVRPPDASTAESSEGALYQEKGEWFRRQPQLFPFSPKITLHGPGIDWRETMRTDPSPLVSRPMGVLDGESFSTLFAEQWASFAEYVEFDLMLMRDETTTPVHSGRISFDESSEPATVEQIGEWSEALIATTREIKLRSPRTFLCLYSSGLSPTVEARFGRLDVVRVVAEGMIDGWVDQTWGGAWQDWWDAGWQGWTFQLSNLLARAALIAEGNLDRTDGGCRHYPLVQLLDGWEPYDTLHDYPHKLTWGIWAFTHATVSSPGGPKGISGHYLAVANDRTGELISESDLGEIVGELTAAVSSASELDRTLGPVLMSDRAHTAVVGAANSEPAEDAAGFLMKWGLPMLSSTTPSLCVQAPEGLITGPAQADLALRTPGSVIVSGIDDLSIGQRKELGLGLLDQVIPMGYSRGYPPFPIGGMRATSWPYMSKRTRSHWESPGTVIYDSAEGVTALKTLSGTHWWSPPTIANGTDRRMTHYQIGSADPHYAVCRSTLEERASRGWVTVRPGAIHETVSCHAWVSRGALHVLLGNLESGWLGDSRHERSVTILIPSEFTERMERPYLASRDGKTFKVSSSDSVTLVLSAESCLVLSLIDKR